VRLGPVRAGRAGGTGHGAGAWAELVRLVGGHYAPFLDAHEQAVAAELSFLRRHLLAVSSVPAVADSAASAS
jgi:hypothetical protein